MVLGAGLLLLAGGALAWLGGEGPKVRENLYVPFVVAWSSGELLRERRPRLARALYGVAGVLLVVHVALHVLAALGGLLGGWRARRVGPGPAGPAGVGAGRGGRLGGLAVVAPPEARRRAPTA
ncbi:hypothetical protein BJP40_05635 [Streptomyces sp. CC53]|uniref:hypothetical protein n=1 Tax=unclassified Streptomyces TaxID=2593676 RepID=UPI0008DC738D|nr:MULTISPECIES: hypothetical protein [unclassified Streptomyces]OII61397.1 hypothetical protein BJP40_05635 [Streptomyces sp. CC53]